MISKAENPKNFHGVLKFEQFGITHILMQISEQNKSTEMRNNILKWLNDFLKSSNDVVVIMGDFNDEQNTIEQIAEVNNLLQLRSGITWNSQDKTKEGKNDRIF